MQKHTQRRPLGRRSKVLVREAEAEAQVVSKKAEVEPATSGSTPPSVNRNSGNLSKNRSARELRRRIAADFAMGGARKAQSGTEQTTECGSAPV